MRLRVQVAGARPPAMLGLDRRAHEVRPGRAPARGERLRHDLGVDHLGVIVRVGGDLGEPAPQVGAQVAGAIRPAARGDEHVAQAAEPHVLVELEVEQRVAVVEEDRLEHRRYSDVG